jgi:hypothetical protein
MSNLAHVINHLADSPTPSAPEEATGASAVLYLKNADGADVETAVRDVAVRSWCIDAFVAPGHPRVVFIRYATNDADLHGMQRDLRELGIDAALISC